MISTMYTGVRVIRNEVALILAVAMLFKEAISAGAGPTAAGGNNKPWYCRRGVPVPAKSAGHCMGWRTAVESNNVAPWLTIPAECEHHVEAYMNCGQYEEDLNVILDQMIGFINSSCSGGGGGGNKGAWVLDVDDTCLSNLFYYKTKRYGLEPYDPGAFKAWALRAACPAIPTVLTLFRKLISKGISVFLLTGRDEQTFAKATIANLHNQGFFGYTRLILRNATYKGQGAMVYKSQIRKQLVAEGFRILATVGDQWTDLLGDFSGNRTFKLPNPMYFVP